MDSTEIICGSHETYRKRRKLMPLNFPLNFHCFWKSMEMESEYSMKVAVESTEFHGNLRDWSGSENACIIRCILSDRV